MTDTEKENNEPLSTLEAKLEDLHTAGELLDAFIALMPGSDQLDASERENILQELQLLLEEDTAEREEAAIARALLLASETPEETKTREILENLNHPERADIIKALLTNQRDYDATQADCIAHGSQAPRPIMKTIMPEKDIANILDRMISFDLVGVQPMQGPVGLLYSLRYRLGEDKLEETIAEDKEATFRESYVPLNDEIDITPKSFTELTEPQQQRLTLDVISAAIEARTKRLSCRWTIEAQADLDDQHGLNIEDELRSALAHEIALENDFEILMDLRHLAKYQDGVRANGSRAKELTIDVDYMSSKRGVENAAAVLSVEIFRAANDIARATRRGAGNWIVISPAVYSLLQMTGKVAPSIKTKNPYPSGLAHGGILNHSMQIYIDSYAADNSILVGYKGGGRGELDTGYTWTPYIPLMAGGVVVDPLTFQPTIQFMTRAGKYCFSAENNMMGNSSDYYRLIDVKLPEDEEEEDITPVNAGCLSPEMIKDLGQQGKEISENIRKEVKPMLTSENDGIVIGENEEEV